MPAEITILGPRSLLVTQQLTSLRTLPDGSASDCQFALTIIWELEPEG